MLNKKVFIPIACFVTFFPLLCFGFDCNRPDFGSPIQDLNKDGYFIKYMEKGGVSYYNHTGPCRLQAHSFDNPAISYAFVDDQLYARIVSVPKADMDPGQFLEKLEQIIPNLIGTSQMQKKQDGDWVVCQWVNEKENLKYKIKSNSITGQTKGAWYYEPLREKLKSKTQAIDPVEEVE